MVGQEEAGKHFLLLDSPDKNSSPDFVVAVLLRDKQDRNMKHSLQSVSCPADGNVCLNLWEEDVRESGAAGRGTKCGGAQL